MFPHLLRPLLFGHRGASLYAPENTFDSFDLALRLGADVLELDVHLSSDNEVVVIHDATLERTTNGKGWVREHTYAQLAALDAGFHFRNAEGEQPFLGRGSQIMRLADLLITFKHAHFNIELKQPAMAPHVLNVLAGTGIGASQVLLAAGNDRIMGELEEAKPGCPLGLSKGQTKQVLRAAWVGEIPAQFAGRPLEIPLRYCGLPLATKRVIDKAHQANIEVHLWTLNTPKRAELYLQRGVDGIMSDDPGALLQVIRHYRGKDKAGAKR